MNPEKILLDFLENIGEIDFDFVIRSLGYLFILFWLVVLGWVWTDSGEKSSNLAFRIFSVLLVATLNILGLIIYLIIRPRQSIQEIYWADLERRYLKYETGELGDCAECGFQLQPGFVNCPNCAKVIKTKCKKCDVHIDTDWQHCPFCGTKNKGRVRKDDSVNEEEMERRIKESKEHAEETVKSKKTRYAGKSGFAVKIGDSVIEGVRKWGEMIDGLFRRKKGKATKK